VAAPWRKSERRADRPTADDRHFEVTPEGFPPPGELAGAIDDVVYVANALSGRDQ
jgi:hypothetical protein